MKTIKRYANRRLYDAETSRTINLEEVAELLRAGENIRVIDNISGEDITSKVLGQTFLKLNESSSVKNDQFLNYVLTLLIRESEGGFINLVKKLLFTGLGVSRMTGTERSQLLNAVKANAADGSKDNQDKFLEDLAKKGQQEADKIWEGLIEFTDNVRGNVESSIKNAVEKLESNQAIDDFVKKVFPKEKTENKKKK